ncbi:DUF3307 domain-containing protein [Roseovarius spongiae]|uniref:DUF3307 domain-containing protein n=1 Tax=Roseovarius spongiae TaxID=2320272 RepID=A0A3A8B5Q5_9RHOB|nr:DUF3307 domain-containing protein [Roseovarius spongiae]RKF15226.1 DUF3307 domain-containing protein [Roseovarius spongiae]
MIATLTALLLAHALADFALQTDWINANKTRLPALLLHGAIVWLTAHAALGLVYDPWLSALALAHVLIDATKVQLARRLNGFRGIGAFLADQGAHLLTLLIVARLAPDLWQGGAWAGMDALLPLYALLAGLVVTLTAGQYAVGLLMRPHSRRVRNDGLRDGGRLIGLLERGLIYLLILAGQPLGVGFLIAAKSILRFGTATRDQRSAEYVIIGTLASFGWAIAVALGVQALLTALPPLEIGARGP